MNLPTNSRQIWLWFRSNTDLSEHGIAGLMGNLYAESGMVVNRKQGDFTAGYSRSASYTLDVDSGVIPKAVFVKDSIGYGLAQWTYFSRKNRLYEYAKSKNKSIGDLSVQLEFIMSELNAEYGAVHSALKSASSVRGASDFVLKFYEQPADQGSLVQDQRASFGQCFYDAFHDTVPEITDTTISEIERHLDLIEQEVKIIRGLLNNT